MANEWITRKPDGTIKQVNPFTGLEVWTVTGRGYKPVRKPVSEEVIIVPGEEESHCDFCETRYLHTPPEKARLTITGDSYKIEKFLGPDGVQQSRADFRRIGNLFEIVSHDYWLQNYDFRPSPEMTRWKEEYLKAPGGLDHVLKILDYKLTLSGKTRPEREGIPLQEKLQMADAFFTGGHELIVSKKHFVNRDDKKIHLCSSGELSVLEHFYYTKFTIEAMRDIYQHNRYVRYISIFQNWLKPAGASFDHLHKQLVAVDEWGVSIERELDLLRHNLNIYNLNAVNYASYKNLVFAENDYAVAFADFGHRFPTLAVYSKSDKPGVLAMEDEEIQGMSDLVHACHCAMTSSIPCNEEWYYSPVDAIDVMPWHILIKWRINNPAGFEGGTKIYINTIDPYSLRDRIVPRLYELRDEGRIGKMKIGEECSCKPNSLKYYKCNFHSLGEPRNLSSK